MELCNNKELVSDIEFKGKINDNLKPLWYNFKNWKRININCLLKLNKHEEYNFEEETPIKFVELGRNRNSNANLNGQSRVYLSWDVASSNLKNPFKFVVVKSFKNKNVKDNTVKIYKHINRFDRIKKDIIQYKSDNYSDILFEWLPNTCNLNDVAITKKFKNDKLNIDLLKIFYRIVDTIVYLKEIGVAHRDIKPDNFLIKIERFFDFDNEETSSDIIPVIIDFGFSSLNKNIEEEFLVNDMKGTPVYAAPEVFNYDILQYCPFKADVWSLGLTLYKLKMGENLFRVKFVDDKITYSSKYNDLINKDMPNICKFSNDLHSDIRDIILACCKYNPEERISLYELKEMISDKMRQICCEYY